jgi:glycine cleavage system regulatory protein
LNISSKAFAITTDNAAAMLVCGREMKDELKNTFNNINFSHFRCGAHILNLAVQHGLQVHDVTVDKVRKFMIKVHNSNKLLEDFWRIFKSQSIEFLSPQLDIHTRWNSTFLMINKMIQIKVQANMLIAQHSNEFTNICFDDNDWKNLQVSWIKCNC